MKEALTKLLKVKSLVTILLTLTFIAVILLGRELPEALVNIYMIIIGFYFGTQLDKRE